MATWMTKVNQRVAGQEVQITAEAHIIGADVGNFVFLNEVPRLNTPSSVTVMQGVTSFTEVTGTPSAGQFRVYYEGRLMGAVEFHTADNNKAITVSYFGRGSNVFARDLNRLQNEKLDRDGAQALLGPLRFTAGSSSSPAVTFDVDSTLGLFRQGTNTLGITANGTVITTVSPSGLNVVSGSLTVGGISVALSTHTHSLSSLTGTLSLAQLAASGTRDQTTFLRGDGTWAVVSSGDGSGISEAFANTKYLQLIGGTLTGPLAVTSQITASRYLLESGNMAMRGGASEQSAIISWNGLQLIGARNGTVDIVPSTESGGLRGAGVIVPVQTAGVVGFYVRGASGQTAALTQWASSANTVLAAVSATGVISAADFTVSGVSVALSTHTHTLSSLTGQLALSQIGATGTRDSTTYLRGDGTWAPISSTGGLTLAEADARYVQRTGGNITGNLSVDGTLTVGGTAVSVSGHSHAASDITTGTLADARLSANVSLLNTAATVTAARTYVLSSLTTAAVLYRISGDAQPRFQIRLDGQLAWGAGGAAATDVFLSRSGTSALVVTGSLNVTGTLSVNGTAVSTTGHTHTAADITTGVFPDARLSTNVRLLNAAQTISAVTTLALTSATDAALLLRTASDTQPRLQLRADGQLAWGPGGSTVTDVTLSRTSGASLSLSGSLAIAGSLTVGGNSVVFAGHTHSAGDVISGTLADARLSANVMLLNVSQTRSATLTSAHSTSTDIAFAARLTSDTTPRVAVRADGSVQWGSGSAVADVTLFRSSVNTLGVSGGMSVSGTLGVTGLATFSGNITASGTSPTITASGTTARIVTTDGTVTGDLGISGTALRLGTTTSHALLFQTNSVNRWQIEATTGHFFAASDNSFDIGAIGASRPRNLYVAQGVYTNLLNLNDGQLTMPLLRDYGEVRSSVSLSAGTLTLNINNANVFEVTLTGNVTTVSILNASPSDNACTITLFVRQDATGGRTISWPASVRFGNLGAPTLSGANKLDIIYLTTLDGGSTWFGSYLQNY
jgi:cytoskeletal protein CcmA (bactofilin family)